MKTPSRDIRLKYTEVFIKNILLFCAVLSIFTTIAIVLSLSFNAIEFFKEVSVFEFLFGTEWTPLFMNPKYGVLPLISGTLIVTVGAAIIAIPIGLFSAIYLSEYAPKTIRKILKPFLEILAGIPSIVYGFFALTYITPLLQKLIPRTEIYNAASASIAVGIMIMPIVASLSEDAMMSVPNALRHGGYALGATKFEVVKGIVIPSALSGIVASFVLAVSRAIGETMIVVLAAGARPNLTLNPLESVQTLTAFIVQASKGDLQHGTRSYYALYAVGMVLFIITFGMNIFSRYIVRRREVAMK
ncbi:phosphate ABC transporter permease subunit PstC [Cellulosilyticum sp. I15G10I2]|uniref:phosphate ABC transporter permease subunit PstC n=1 Tax=Cellulosilyticum sp. I15G10I2 TaxID=1892843 RepID=UPI00085C0038|nr:phosphate ABC transporter permease subunit PstC [Cellulosilyticum sp. I15G10I2]